MNSVNRHVSVPQTSASRLTRRGFLIAGGSAFAAAAVGFDSLSAAAASLGQAPAAAAMSAVSTSTIKAASALWVNLATKVAQKAGETSTFSESATGSGTVRPSSTNLFAASLPFAGYDVATNKLPAGWEWHSAAALKTLVAVSANRIVFKGKTSTSQPTYYAGIRTLANVVKPGQTVLLAFNADFTGLVGDDASIVISLLRTSDQGSTIQAKVYNSEETAGALVTARFRAPTGGTDGYRVVITARAGTSRANQEVTLDISNLRLVVEPTNPVIGALYAIPMYSPSNLSAHTVVLKPSASGGVYHVIVKTTEFGWGAASTTLTGSDSTIDLGALFGPNVNMTVLEAYVIARSKWQKGWLDSLETAGARTPLRYLNGASLATSRPESQTGLARATGMPGALSAGTSELNGHIPGLAAPAVEMAAAYNPNRLSHLAFQTDQTRYIGDVHDNGSVRSEILPGEPVAYDTNIWISFWVKANTMTDALLDHKSILFQYRYTKNPSGDSSALSPELSLAQLANNQFRLTYRSDKGVADLTGDGASTKITTVNLAPVAYDPSQWHSFVVKARFSASGGGYLGAWYNGKELINKAVALGYKRAAGPGLHVGSYKFSDSKCNVEFQQLEHGTRDLTSRISSPLAV